ncbi:hypothetical protein DSL72_006622 [Monilinia vaccinii-corymbosi]|uniref:Zn(2)-C6 fungal-type domain-containing protein n=1 Tax=Monilinia vaccinii-corymbosi TaxID=61207 RepID=A0A8A3PP96_9HELO|nr:hypothetical protein DSL72_006622 [Monilinia vaccinii-corymbosi]
MTRHPPEDGSKYPLPTGTSDNQRFPPCSSPSAPSHYAPLTGSSDSHRAGYTPNSTEYPSPPDDTRGSYTSHGSQHPNPHPDTRGSYTSNQGSYPAAQGAPDSRASHRSAMGEPQYSAEHRMAPSGAYNGPQHHPLRAMDHHPQVAWGPSAHTSNGYSEPRRTPPHNGSQYPGHPTAPNNGQQHSGHSTAPPQDNRYPHTGYNAPPPGYPYHDSRGYQQPGSYKAPSSPRTAMTFKQSAPRQRTAIACKYCRRRKIRCSGFHADGSAGRCSNCERFKQDCIFTPVSSQQAFVPIQAVYAVTGGNGLGPNTQLYGAHGQPLPMNPSPTGSNHMFRPPQTAFEPQVPPHHQQMFRPSHALDLPSLSRSPYNQNANLPSPTGSSGSQSRKRPADEQPYSRMPPPPPGPSSMYQGEENGFGRRPVVEDERYRSTLPPPHNHTPNYGYQRGENNLTHRPIENSRQMASQFVPARPSEAPRTSHSPNASSSSSFPQRSTGNFPPTQLPPPHHGSGRQFSSPTAPAGTSSGEPQGPTAAASPRQTPTTVASRPDPMAISNFVAKDNRDIDQGMLGRLGQNWRS